MSVTRLTIGKIVIKTPIEKMIEEKEKLATVNNINPMIVMGCSEIPVEIDPRDDNKPLAKRLAWETAIEKLVSIKGVAQAVVIDHRHHSKEQDFVDQFGALIKLLVTSPKFAQTKVTWDFEIVFSYFDLDHMDVILKLQKHLNELFRERMETLHCMGLKIQPLAK